MSRKIASAAATIFVAGVTATAAYGGAIAIINGSSTTTEPGTTSLITNNLVTLENAAGNTVTVFDATPASLAGFSSVWDVRWFDSAALTSTVDMEYANFLAAGGALFVMGENIEFPNRDSSIISLIASLGGGSGIALYDTCGNGQDSQTVNAPFTGPNSVSGLTYVCSGGFSGSGSGQFITEATPAIGSGLAFGPGTLSGAPDGALTTILDVNFMEDTDPASQNLLKNLIVYLDNIGPAEPPAGTPEPGTFVMLGTGFVGLGLLARKRLKR